MQSTQLFYLALVSGTLSLYLIGCTNRPPEVTANQQSPVLSVTANQSFQSPFANQPIPATQPKLIQVLYNGKPHFKFTYQAGQLATAWEYYADYYETTDTGTDTLLALKAVYQPNTLGLPTVEYWSQQVSRKTGELIGPQQLRNITELAFLPGDSSVRVQEKKMAVAPIHSITEYDFDEAGFVRLARSVGGRLLQEYIRDARHNVTAYRYAVPDRIGQYWFYREAIVYDDRPNPFYGLNWQYDHLVLALTPNNAVQYRNFQGKQTYITYKYRPDGYPTEANVVTDGETSTWTYIYDR